MAKKCNDLNTVNEALVVRRPEFSGDSDLACYLRTILT